MIVRQGFRFELDPNNVQLTLLKKHAGTARFAYNWALQRVKAALDARARGENVKIPGAIELHREWNVYKRDHAPWWSEVSKCAPQEAFRDLSCRLRNFFDSRAGRRKGPRVGFPRFRRRGVRDRFRYSTGGFGVQDARHVRLPRIGYVRTKEPTTKLLRLIQKNKARVTSATVSRHADRWFVSFGCEVHRDDPEARTGEPVGIDQGLSSFAVCSNGEVIGSPRAFQRRLRKLKRLSRSVSRKQEGSNNRAKARSNLARCHRKIADVRRDHLHKVTTHLARAKPVIVIEDLNVAGMVRNRTLARRIFDASWAEFARMLAYKCEWYGAELMVADRFFPSSKTCSQCGAVKSELSLSQRIFRCETCGAVIDRDLNAARNLARLSGPVAASAAETQNACGGERYMGSAQVLPDEAGREQPSEASVSQPSARSEVLEIVKKQM